MYGSWTIEKCTGDKKQLNCKIFRCGIYKKTGRQILPHSKKVLCDKLLKNNLIYGCAKPFRFVGKYVESCDYIWLYKFIKFY